MLYKFSQGSQTHSMALIRGFLPRRTNYDQSPKWKTSIYWFKEEPIVQQQLAETESEFELSRDQNITKKSL
jgi:hypothetical protein